MAVIAFDRIDDLDRGHRELSERAIAASGHDEHDVYEVRVSECGVEIDVVDFEAPGWPLRTITC